MRKKLFPTRKRKPKLINKQVVKKDPEVYGTVHIKAIQNTEGWYRP